jgi:parvulin-like peptidyl-prolyl isomerase
MTKKAMIFLLISLTYCSDSGPSVTQDTIAVVNNRTITKDQFASQAQSITNTPGVDLSTQNGRVTIAKDMINEELVFQQAIKDQFYLKNLDVKHDLVREYLKNKFGKDLPVITDQQVDAFYKAHQNDLEQVRASHILITPKKKDDAASKQEAKILAQKVHSEITSGKISFVDAVKKYSDDPGTKSKDGDLSFFSKSQMVEPFSNAAFALKKIGDISQPVETQFGYHIIQLTGEQRNMDVYKEKIRWKLYQDAMQPKIDEYFNQLREKAKIQLIDKQLMSITIPQQQ